MNAPKDLSSPPSPEVPKRPRSERREQALRDAMRAFVRDQFLYTFGAQEPAAGCMPISLQCRLNPAAGWDVTFDPPLADQFHGQLENALAEQDVYRRGHVYCFRCRTASCEHSVPPDELTVFRGYTQTGTPEWAELVQIFVDLRDERIDQLFGKPPVILAGIQLGSHLREQQLAYFGRASRTYSVLGQVVAGYFPIPGGACETWRCGDRAALTVQIVEVRGNQGMELKLNPIIGRIGGDGVDELLVSHWERTVGKPLADAREVLGRLEAHVRVQRETGRHGDARKEMKTIPRLLLKLKRALEQGERQRRRRTRHAEQHKRQERPIHKALEEARAADAASLFRDEKRNTWVACGKQGRAHVFTFDGRHVTSFTLKSGGAEFRVRTGRWAPLDEDEAARFRTALRAL